MCGSRGRGGGCQESTCENVFLWLAVGLGLGALVFSEQAFLSVSDF